MVLRDIMCSGYVAGGNTRFFGEAAAKAGNGAYKATEIVQAITNRLSFVDDASGEYESMLAFAVPYGHGDRRDQVYSLSARLLPWEVTRGESNWHDYFPGGTKFGHYDHYSRIYGLEQVHFGEDIRAAENMEFISQGSVNNALCFIGPHRTYSAWSKTMYELTPGQGHFGPDALPEYASHQPRRTAMQTCNFAMNMPKTCLLTNPTFPSNRMLAGAAAGRLPGRCAQRHGQHRGGRALPDGLPDALNARAFALQGAELCARSTSVFGNS